MGLCSCSMFCCALLCVHSSFFYLDGEERADCFAFLSSWCLMIVVWLFHTMLRARLQFVIVAFPDHTHLLLWGKMNK